MTLIFKSINPIMFVNFALLGLAWTAINVNSLPMVVEMCKGSDVGKFTGYYYTASMAAKIVTPILAGTLMRLISYKILFIYAAFFTILSLLTMTQVRHCDQKVKPRRILKPSRIWVINKHFTCRFLMERQVVFIIHKITENLI